ncbi:MAG TPA: hypothetical protein VMC43_01410 [Candidatus Paceibacterota bacterium]|nr:hypothetical protein [Candidatus Paceibacterota bacterium]
MEFLSSRALALAVTGALLFVFLVSQLCLRWYNQPKQVRARLRERLLLIENDLEDAKRELPNVREALAQAHVFRETDPDCYHRLWMDFRNREDEGWPELWQEHYELTGILDQLDDLDVLPTSELVQKLCQLELKASEAADFHLKTNRQIKLAELRAQT